MRSRPPPRQKYYGSFTRSLSLRIKISAGAAGTAVLYIAPAPAARYAAHSARFRRRMLRAKAAIMLLSLDVVTTAVLKVTRPRFGIDTCGVLLPYKRCGPLIVALSDTARAHIPLCALTSLSLFGILISTYLSVKGLRKATRVPAIGKALLFRDRRKQARQKGAYAPQSPSARRRALSAVPRKRRPMRRCFSGSRRSLPCWRCCWP